MKITPKQYAHAWYSALKETTHHDEMNHVSHKFVYYIHHKGEIKMLPQIVRLIEQFESAETKRERVTILTAHEMQSNEIRTEIEHFFKGKTVDIQTIIDSSLIGGFQIETENRRIDYSIQGQLRQLHNTLNSNS